MTTKQTFKIDYRSYGEAVEAAARREKDDDMPMNPAIRGYLNDDGTVTFDFGSDLTPDHRPIVCRAAWDLSTFDPNTPLEDYDDDMFHDLGEFAAESAREDYRFEDQIMDEIQFFNELPG